MTEILESKSEKVLEAYFVWQTVRNFGSLLGPRETARKKVTHLNNVLAGIENGVRARREDVCLQSLLENYGFMIGKYYVQEAFPKQSKYFAEEVINATIEAFKSRLHAKEMGWLDETTRLRIEEKASSIRVKVGYATSPNVTSPLALRSYYFASRPRKGKFFESVVATRIMDTRRKWSLIGTSRDRGMWEMIPTEVDAYYQPQANEMVFPAGVLQAPFFSTDYPEYLAFGSMASLAGRELIVSRTPV